MMTMRMYVSLGEIHVKEDPIVDWERVYDAQREVKGHLRALNHVFRPGMAWKSSDRVWKTSGSVH